MSFAASQPNLRLVGGGSDGFENAHWRAQEQAKLAVVKENRLAAAPGMDANDPRWVLAMQTQARLQGATLTPENREKLLKSGRKLGLRPFDSNLVIAVVQDRARQDQNATAMPEKPPTLRLVTEESHAAFKVAKPAKAARTAATWPQWFLAIAGGLVVAASLVRWLISAP